MADGRWQKAESRKQKAEGGRLCTVRCLLLTAYCLLVFAYCLLFLVTPSVGRAQGPQGAQAGSCWQCHRQPNIQGTNGIAAANALCQDCHAKPETVGKVDGKQVSFQVSDADFGKTRHATIACTSCHATVSRSPHKETEAAACGSCHSNLSQHIAMGDPHLNVDCAACHFKFDAVTRDPTTRRIAIARVDTAGQPIARADHTLASPVPCERCHARGNAVNVAAATLSPKDITCIGCHLSAPIPTNPLSWTALIIFLIGLAFSASIWLSGSVAGKKGLSFGEKSSLLAERAVAIVFSRRLFAVLRAALLDGIVHRRVLKESVARWVAHSLILLPFVARFLLGIFTGIAAQFNPDAPLTRVLIDRDAPPVAFTYDLLAVLIALGAGYAGYLRATDKQRRDLTAGQDMFALILFALIFVVGFIVEGAHIIVAQLPWDQAFYAFGGAAFAVVLNLLPLDWSTVYPFLFYAHAVLVAIFVAYLPFSKFFHILVSLFVVAIRPALGEGEHAP
ncbi:MAG: cytochrome c3 family protein [Chloroflexota bacterium]|nr:cytochrome c3 family protein [Chloroflexota bacterium]